MIFHEASPDTFVEVTGDLTTNDITVPFGNFTLWSDAELADHSCYRLDLPSAPDGKFMASYTVARLDGVVQIVPAWSDIPIDSLKSRKISAVEVKRTTLLAAGFDYDFDDARGVHHIGTTDDDMKGWDEVAKVSSAALALGLVDTEISIVTNTGAATITALEFQSILLAAGNHRQPIWQRSFELQGQIAGAADADALAGIDPEAGWP